MKLFRKKDFAFEATFARIAPAAFAESVGNLLAIGDRVWVKAPGFGFVGIARY